jgi:hypothetical protein
MTAEPIRSPEYDPAEILRALPENWHEEFLADYHGALEAAHEVWRFQQLRDVLHLWRLRAIAVSDPTFEARAEAAREGRSDEFFPAENVIPGWADRR